MTFGFLFLKKFLILGGVIGAPVALVFSDFFSGGKVLEVMSNESTQVTGQKKVAILVANKNEIKNGDESALNCQPSDQQKLLGIGMLQEINSNQVEGELIKGGLVAVGCGTNGKLEIVGNPENFWYGVLDYEKVVVELLQAGTNDEQGDKKVWISWDTVEGKWKTEKENETTLESYDKCFNKKLPSLGEKVKNHFLGGKIDTSSDDRRIELSDLQDCKDKIFSNQVMTIYTKNGNNDGQKWEEGNSGWGSFKGAYGDRLSKIKVGDGKIGTSDGKVFYEFPRKISLKSKNHL